MIELLHKYWSTGLTDEEVSIVIHNYLIDKGTDPIRVGLFIVELYAHREYLPLCLSYIFDVWRREHHINYIYKNPDPNDANRRVIVLIY